jgi:CheY-like chemotaxis protein
MGNLLLVDDDESFADVTAEVLRYAGHTVRTAADGEQGLACITTEKPDLVLCDVDMPGLDGPGMARRLVARNRGDEKIPLVVISGGVNLVKVVGALGSPYFLAKPCDLDALLAIVDKALVERVAPVPT